MNGKDAYPDVLDDSEYTFASLPEWKTLAIHSKSCDRVAPVNRWEMPRKHGKQCVITVLLPSYVASAEQKATASGA